MPNWCQNVMYIKNHNPSLVEAIEEGNLCHYIVPEQRDEDDEPTDGWYEWRLEHWGTKWDIRCESVEVTDDMLIVKFDTAWSPPDAVWEIMHQKGYDFEAYYVEYGMEYYGSFINGVDATNQFPDGQYAPKESEDYDGWVHPNHHLTEIYS